MADWGPVSGQASGTALAEYAAKAGETRLLKLTGVFVHIMGAGSTASIIELHAGENSNTISTQILAASTGGDILIQEPSGLITGRYIAVDATSHLATSNTVVIWGDYA